MNGDMEIFLIMITLCGSPEYLIGHSDVIDLYGNYEFLSQHNQFPEALSILLNSMPPENLIEIKMEEMMDGLMCV